MFKEEGLHITKDGYFIAKYDSDKEVYNSYQIPLEEIETHLYSIVHIAEDLRLKHIFIPILESKIFPIVFKKSFWSGIINEINTLPWKDWEYELNDESLIKEDSILYLEVYSHLNYDSKENSFKNPLSSLYFHGISSTVSYCLSPTPITDYMNHPIKVGNTSIYDDEKLNIKNAKSNITLGNLLNCILWDMSFYGLGKDRDNFLIDLPNKK